MTTKTTPTRRPAKRRPASPKTSITNWFRQWLDIRDTVDQLGERTDTLRLRILDTLTEAGDEDEKGNFWIDLTEPVEFKDHKGKVFQYTKLKKERHLRPAQPTADPEKAEALLRKKNLYLTAAQEKVIRDLRIACPYVTISVDIDPDAVAQLWFKDIINEREYESTLVEQKESFQFRPSE
jgi:hypothetical protein